MFCDSILHLPLDFSRSDILGIFEKVLAGKDSELFKKLPYGGSVAVGKFIDVLSTIDCDKFRYKEFNDG